MFNVSSSTADAYETIRGFFNVSNSESLQTDFVQFLSLSAETRDFLGVIQEAVTPVMQQGINALTVGREFDLFTRSSIEYGQHVWETMRKIASNPALTLDPGIVASPDLSVRRTVKITSGIKVYDFNDTEGFTGLPIQGWQYVEFSSIDEVVHTGRKGALNQSLNSRGGHSFVNRLFINPETGQFHLLDNRGGISPVVLGDTSVIDEVLRGIRKPDGVLSEFNSVLQSLSDAEKDFWYHQKTLQPLFYKVFKTVCNRRLALAAAQADHDANASALAAKLAEVGSGDQA